MTGPTGPEHYDPGPLPEHDDAAPLFQSIPPLTWTRVLLPFLFEPAGPGHQPGTRRVVGPIWVKNDGAEQAYITIGTDGTVGLQGGEGIRWLIRTGPHPDLRG